MCSEKCKRFFVFVSGEDAYRPDVYGNSITVVRGVTQSGTSSYKIKDNRGRIVCDKKVREELDRILDSFAIQVDNPIAVCTLVINLKSMHANFSYHIKRR